MSAVHQSPCLEVRDLRLVAAIQREGGLIAASASLHVTQSALSHHLRDLEARLGVRLFDRVGRRLALNEHGARVLELADRVLPQFLSVERDLRNPAADSGVFRVTTGCYTVYHWLNPTLERLRWEAPGTRVEIVVDATRRAFEAVLSGEVDAAVVPQYQPDARFISRRVFTEEIVAVARPTDAIAERGSISARALGARRIFVQEGTPREAAWVRATLGKSAAFLRDAVRVPLTEAIVELVRAGEGVALLGSWTVARSIERGELVARPLKPALRRTIAVVTARAKGPSRPADVLASSLRLLGAER